MDLFRLNAQILIEMDRHREAKPEIANGHRISIFLFFYRCRDYARELQERPDSFRLSYRVEKYGINCLSRNPTRRLVM